jgi:hypothetical protein
MYERSYEYITSGLFLGIPMFISLTLSNKKYLIFGIGMIFLIVIFMFAGIRRVIFVFLLSILFYFLLSIIHNPRKNFSSIILLGLLVGMFYVILPWMESTVQDLSPHLYYRLFARTHDAAGHSLASSDVTRVNNLSLLSNTDTDLFFPHGFNTIRYDKVVGSGVFNDVPIYSIAWIIGLPLTIFLLLYIAYKGVKTFKFYIKRNDSMTLSLLVCLLCMYCMLYLDGTFMTYVYAAPFTGMCLGKIKLYASKRI